MKQRHPSLLPEYAGTGRAIIEPSKIRPKRVRIPCRAVACFLGRALGKLSARRDVTVVHRLTREMSEHPIYQVGKGRKAVAIFNPRIGSAMAAAGLEQIIALGAKRIIACGGAGVLRSDIPPGTVIIPTRALRDEGTSYHYQRRSRTNRPDDDAVRAIKDACRCHGTTFITGMTWTTDTIFRETPQKTAARRKEGCLTVEMEAAALFAVARFRGVRFGQVLSASDDVSGENWDTRRGSSDPSAREKLLVLAIDAVRRMS